MAQTNFYQPPQSNMSNIYRNQYFFPQELITKKAQQEHQKQEDKTDQQNNFLATLALMQLGGGYLNQDPASVISTGIGNFIIPLAYQGGTKLLNRLFGIKDTDATGAKAADSDAILNSLPPSTHQNPNLGNPIPENSLRYERPENNYKNSNLLWDSVSEIPFVQSNYLNDQRQKQAVQDQKNLDFLNRIGFFQNNPFNIGGWYR